MKLCTCCGVEKPLSEFYKRVDSPDGYRNDCKECKKQAVIKQYYANHDKGKLRLKIAHANKLGDNPNWYAENYAKIKGASLAASKAYYAGNAEERKAKQRAWSKVNRGTANALSKRYKLKKRNATPAWLSEFDLLAMKCKYQVAAMLNKHGVEPWHVDHIVPIRGKDVCGLHVPWNLQVIPAKDNLSKGNRICLLF
jgi:hypothetical protein